MYCIVSFMLGGALLLGAACHAGMGGATEVVDRASRRIANLHAFARLYGVVRWFHPSDTAAAIDWDQFAIDGARGVIDAADTTVLRKELTELFIPFAPTVHIASAGEAFPREPMLHPGSVSGLDLVAWQHEGYGDSTVAAGYASKRRHRDREVAMEGALFAMLSQSIDAAPYRGASFRLRGRLRTANHAQGRLWLRIDRGDTRAFYESMARSPIMSRNWTRAEISGVVDTEATKITFGQVMLGSGTTWYDDLEFQVQSKDGTWNAVVVQNGGFEGADPLSAWHPGDGTPKQDSSNEGWSITTDPDGPASGEASLRIRRKTKVLRQELFDETPTAGETVDVDLGSGLRARVPISLYSRADRTLGDGVGARHSETVSSTAASTGFDAIAGAADIIVVWNVFQHFWPYWNVVSVDWSAALDAALAEALRERSVDDHVLTLRRMTAAASDAHATTSCPGQTRRAFPPFRVELVEGQVVVTHSTDKSLERGDAIVSLDGRPIAQALAAEKALVSGSPQWQLVRGLEQLGRGPTGAALSLRIRRHDHEFDVRVDRRERSVAVEPSHPPIERFADGIYYVDLERASMADIDAEMPKLAAAPGVVFDLRVSPNANHDVLSHLLSRPDDANAWLAIPRMIRPDSGSTPVSWSTSGWNLPVRQPHIRGKIAFLTGPNARSYAESVMALVEHYQLGEIVGAATAGTNGDIAQIAAPTGCTTIFTGRRVVKPDGSRLHLRGVQPTVPVAPTIAGIVAGRDELLDRALTLLRSTK